MKGDIEALSLELKNCGPIFEHTEVLGSQYAGQKCSFTFKVGGLSKLTASTEGMGV